MHNNTSRKYSTYLAVLLLGFGLVATTRPYFALAKYEIKQLMKNNSDKNQTLKLESDHTTQQPNIQSNAPKQIRQRESINPNTNRLQIPKIGIDGEIHEGTNPNILNKGVWILPNSSSPDKGGNTVLTAHRYLQSSGPKTFYLLDKLAINDKITIHWKGESYTYTVYESYTAEADQIEIESNTAEPILTLYTCTPLWSSTHRIVVRAHLDINQTIGP